MHINYGGMPLLVYIYNALHVYVHIISKENQCVGSLAARIHTCMTDLVSYLSTRVNPEKILHNIILCNERAHTNIVSRQTVFFRTRPRQLIFLKGLGQVVDCVVYLEYEI